MAGKLAEQQIALLAVPFIELKYTKPAAQDIFPVATRADQEEMLKSFEHAADIIQMVFLHYGTRAIFVGISQGADLVLGGMRELRRRRLAVGARGLLQVQAPVFLFGGGHYAYSVDALNVAGDAGADSADTLNVPWRPSPQWLRDVDMESANAVANRLPVQRRENVALPVSKFQFSLFSYPTAFSPSLSFFFLGAGSN